MQSSKHSEHSETAAPASLTMAAMADLQDHLLTAANDLARLETLLADACLTLLARFQEAAVQVGALPKHDVLARERAMHHLAGAVTGLQFQDMASQLIEHTCQRLSYCADRLASEAFRDDEDGEALLHQAPGRPNPVIQSEMNAGSVELF